MTGEILFFLEESSEGGYEARANGYSIYTEGETLEDLRQSIEDAVRCHFEEADMPLKISLSVDYSKVIASEQGREF